MPPLDTARIRLRAQSVFDTLRLSAPWTPSLHDATLDDPVIFVTFLYDSATMPGPALPDYAIAAIRRPAGISARLAFNSETGDFLEAEGVHKAGTHLPPYVAPERARAAFPQPLAAPEIVWRPCRESSSRFAPFWRYTVDGTYRYVRSDGQIYNNLTTHTRG
jgi:hypothetical protein